MSIFAKIKRNLLWLILSFLPKDQNKAVCQSFYGRGLSDSPGAIATELLSRGWRVYWTVKGEKEAKDLPEGIVPVKIDSARAIYHLCTAGLWVDNSRKWAYTQKRGKTQYVQTWHGFPLKRIEGDAEGALPLDYIEAAKKDSEMATLFLSNSRFLSEIYRNGFWYKGEILECGFPRNDILLKESPETVNKVRKTLRIPEGKRLLLYAPTFRKDEGLEVYDMDYENCVKALNESFSGDWLILAKLHPNIASKASQLDLDPRFVQNASDYPDIQELYLASDALISDYSSVMFDFMSTGKPGFLYVNDLEKYKNDRNFYYDIDKLPYPRAQTNAELIAHIKGFDEAEQKRRMEAFTEEFGICESGSAAKQTVDLVEKNRY